MIPYFDAHCDTGLYVYTRGVSLAENDMNVDLRRLSSYAPCAQVFALCARQGEDMVSVTEAALAALVSELERCDTTVRLCRSAADIAAAVSEGKIAALLSVEGMDRLDCSLDKLRRAYRLGVRIVHLTWNSDDALCGAAMDSGGGLTARGREFVKAAQEMGVVLDMSHISEQGFWDVLECAERPVLAGHSDAMALCDFPRNLTDAQFTALAKAGGVAGLNFCTDFLGLTRDLDAIVAHAEHYFSLGGEKAVCLGGDLDGIDELPGGFTGGGVQDLGALYEAFLRRNWNEDAVRDIFWNNLNAFFKKVL